MDAKGNVWLLVVIPIAVVAFSMTAVRFVLREAPVMEVVFVGCCTAAMALAGVYGVAAWRSPGRSSGRASPAPEPEPYDPFAKRRPTSRAPRILLGGSLGLFGALLLLGGGLVGFECFRAFSAEGSTRREASDAQAKAAEETSHPSGAVRPEALQQYANGLSQAASSFRAYANKSFAVAWGCLGIGVLCFWAGLTFAFGTPRGKAV